MINGQRQHLDVWGRAIRIEPLDTGWTISVTVITYAYDPLGQEQQAVRGSNAATTSYTYDLVGPITHIVDANLGT